MKCSNCECERKSDEQAGAIRLFVGGTMKAFICEECQRGVTVAKVVLARMGPLNGWSYEGYLPAAVQRT